MKCVVVGNSPSIKCLGKTIDNYQIVIRCGVPRLHNNQIDLGTKTDILITRYRKYQSTDPNFIGEFTNQYDYTVSNKSEYNTDNIIILYKNKHRFNLDKNLLGSIDSSLDLGPEEKPTLGLISVYLACEISDDVSICGIETDYHSNYISRGHYGDANYLRVNDRHCLYKEMLYYNRLVRSGRLTVL